MKNWVLLGAGTVLGTTSAYGWWFDFRLGPAHGPGAELGMLAGAAALAVVAWAIKVSRQQMSAESTGANSERARLIRELVAECEARAPDRIDRYLNARHHGIVADTPFAPASAECIDLFRDGHFYGAISLSQAVGEALARHMCRSNQWRPAENFEENVRTLRRRGFIDDAVEAALLRLWEQRDDYHHLNSDVAGDRPVLEELALTKIRALNEVERFVFAWGPSDVPGSLSLVRPQYWPDKKDGRVGVFLRNPSV